MRRDALASGTREPRRDLGRVPCVAVRLEPDVVSRFVFSAVAMFVAFVVLMYFFGWDVWSYATT